ncbi:LysR family transcriptional regulator [cf. Phormidesmis sp. LEGE 11477]|uniref:LysR family transcriptional regulator n=1 Tax=cf. Phormidesmis sp. LEGE 11477 TaxID=1828680 RepID=UPI001880EAF0|nr:LysR family transcriptional regulator [cf. Phormidesmis sp. LEGE 11477]MBE9064668.1 LysR family transcriptional regulator [cf. Phormidesmis sp. LEGE 11477]
MAGKPAKTLREKVKLSQLRTLITVALTGSFSGAALELDVSQSTVSHSIAALEDALGVMLIHRGRQRASLTPVGDRIYAQALAALALIDDMGKEATRARGTEGGLVRIGAFRSLASEILPGAIAHLHEHHPTIQVAIIEYESKRELTDALHEGKVDLVFADLVLSGECETFLLMEDPFIALLPPNFTDKPSQLSWDDLRQHPLITSSSDCCKSVAAHLQQAHPPVEVDYLIANDSTAVSMTRQGLGITLLPKLAAQPIPSEVRVAQLPFEITRPLGISWLKETLLTPATYAFLDTFKHLYRTAERDSPQQVAEHAYAKRS